VLTVVLILYALDAVLAAELVKQFFLYLPHLIVAVVILVLGIVVAGFVARSVLIGAVNLGVAPARPLAVVVRAGIVLMAVAVALETLGIGHYTMPASFLILLAGATLAGALAVGLGSADVVKRWHEERRSRPKDVDETGGISHW
jgi:Mechanosensitive ion channel, conserved TM helix